jgi:hypothetical protein
VPVIRRQGRGHGGDAGRLAPEARYDAMPGLTSRGDSHDITGLNAAPRITGRAPALDADADADG